MITWLGFLIGLVPFFALFICFGTKFINEVDRPIASWWYFLQAFCFFLSRFLDELDGKQARRLGLSSPLGLIFDHGCDAMIAGLEVMIIMKVL